jgi:hypothetical protein
MCASQVTRHTSIRYSSSCHTRANMGASIFFTVAMVRTCEFTWQWWDVQYVPPLPRDLAHLKARIIATLKTIDTPMLTRVWQELEYRIDVCSVTRGAHIEHL